MNEIIHSFQIRAVPLQPLLSTIQAAALLAPICTATLRALVAATCLEQVQLITGRISSLNGISSLVAGSQLSTAETCICIPLHSGLYSRSRRNWLLRQWPVFCKTDYKRQHFSLQQSQVMPVLANNLLRHLLFNYFDQPTTMRLNALSVTLVALGSAQVSLAAGVRWHHLPYSLLSGCANRRLKIGSLSGHKRWRRLCRSYE